MQGFVVDALEIPRFEQCNFHFTAGSMRSLAPLAIPLPYLLQFLFRTSPFILKTLPFEEGFTSEKKILWDVLIFVSARLAAFPTPR
jgi:hypothetical protein